ncbi:MAG: hypothetical protein ABUT20_15165 [Bacteroidota bacterium]
MTHFIISLLLCSGIITVAQKPVDTIAENGIYKSGDDFVHGKLTIPFSKSYHPDISFKSPLGHYNELWIKTKDSTFKFYNDEIWGYRKDGKDFRFVKNDPYQVSYTGKIILYAIPASPGAGKGSTIFFSKTISSPVHDLSRKKLIDAYHDDTSFVQKIKELKWDQSIYKWDKQTGRYVFIGWIN